MVGGRCLPGADHAVRPDHAQSDRLGGPKPEMLHAKAPTGLPAADCPLTGVEAVNLKLLQGAEGEGLDPSCRRLTLSQLRGALVTFW